MHGRAVERQDRKAVAELLQGREGLLVQTDDVVDLEAEAAESLQQL